MVEKKDQQVLDFLRLRDQRQNIPPQRRRSIFDENVRAIVSHNSDSGHTWKKGLNAFSMMTDEEFAEYYNIVKKDQVCTVVPPSSKVHSLE